MGNIKGDENDGNPDVWNFAKEQCDQLRAENEELRLLLKNSEEQKQILEDQLSADNSDVQPLKKPAVEINKAITDAMQAQINDQLEEDDKEALSFMRTELLQDCQILKKIDAVFNRM